MLLTLDPINTRILRFAVGITIAIFLSSAIQWPLALLTPVFTAVILALPLPAPTLGGSFRNMLHTLLAFSLGIVFTLIFLQYPLVYIPLLGFVLFKIYYYSNRGGSFWFTLMALLAVLILPMLGNTSEGLAFGFSLGFIWSSWLAILMVWIAYGLFPDPKSGTLPARPKFQNSYSPVAAAAALKSTLVVLPIVTLFIVYNLSGQLLVMVFAAIFSLTPDIAKGKIAASNSIKSTLIGGMYAWAVYWLLVAVPEFYFFMFLMFFIALGFARKMFSDGPMAGYFSSAFVAMFVLVNSSLGVEGDITSAFLWRVIFITLAAIYVVVALKVLESYWPNIRKEEVALG